MDEKLSFEKGRAFRFLTLLLIILSVFFVVRVLGELKNYQYIGTDKRLDTISVTGEGEAFAIPDLGIFSYGVVTEDLDVNKAQSENAVKSNAILSFLKDKGVNEKDIKTTEYNVYPRYEYTSSKCVIGPCPPANERVLKGFEVNQSIAVKIRDVKNAGELLSGVGERGATNISSLSFVVDDDEAVKEEAREMAINNAKEKAKKLAKELDVKLVKIVSFSEGGVYPVARYDYMLLESAQGGSSAPTPNIPVGENKVVSNVTIVYQIR